MPEQCLMSWEVDSHSHTQGPSEPAIYSSSSHSTHSSAGNTHLNAPSNQHTPSDQPHRSRVWQSWLTLAALLSPSDMCTLQLHPGQPLTLRSAGPHTVLAPRSGAQSNSTDSSSVAAQPSSSNSTTAAGQQGSSSSTFQSHPLPSLTVTVRAVPSDACPPSHVMLAPPLLHALRLLPHMRASIAAVPPLSDTSSSVHNTNSSAHDAPPSAAPSLPSSCMPANDHSSNAISMHHLMALSPSGNASTLSSNSAGLESSHTQSGKQQQLAWAATHNTVAEQLGGGSALQGVCAWHCKQMQGMQHLISTAQHLQERLDHSVSLPFPQQSSLLLSGTVLHLTQTSRSHPSPSTHTSGSAYLMVVPEPSPSTRQSSSRTEQLPCQQHTLPHINLGPPVPSTTHCTMPLSSILLQPPLSYTLSSEVSSDSAAGSNEHSVDLGCLPNCMESTQGTSETRCAMMNAHGGACAGDVRQAVRRVEWLADVLQGALHQVGRAVQSVLCLPYLQYERLRVA